jgi:transketolase C-terminal domain/subunit
LLVVEESSPAGGLGSVVATWHAGLAGDRPRLVRLGPRDELALGSPARETLQARWGYGQPAVVEVCRDLWRG